MRQTSGDYRAALRATLSAALLALAPGTGSVAQDAVPAPDSVAPADEVAAADAGTSGTDATAAAEAATAVVRALHAALVAVAADAAHTSRDERYRLLEPTILATHDLPYIAELTIRRQWRDLDAEERHRFVAAFTRLSVMTYASRFAGVGPDAFTLRGTEPAGDGRLEVHAAIVRPGEDDISLDYLLHVRDGEWRIVNILADGVSDLALKRAQYQRVLGDGGTIADLIALLGAEADAL